MSANSQENRRCREGRGGSLLCLREEKRGWNWAKKVSSVEKSEERGWVTSGEEKTSGEASLVTSGDEWRRVKTSARREREREKREREKNEAREIILSESDKPDPHWSCSFLRIDVFWVVQPLKDRLEAKGGGLPFLTSLTSFFPSCPIIHILSILSSFDNE